MKLSVLVLAPFINFDSLASRPNFVAQLFAQFATVDVITTDFDHQTKTARTKQSAESYHQVVYIRTLPYTSNTSLDRLVSHVTFSLRAFHHYLHVSKQYNVVYVTAPLNLLAFLVFLFSPRKVKIIDIVDIWPDVLPFPSPLRMVLFLFFGCWKSLLVMAVWMADGLMTVSDRFLRDAVQKYRRSPKRSRRFYIAHPSLPIVVSQAASVPTIAYVGNLGKLYDFTTLLDALTRLQGSYPWQLVIVGDGDRREWLLGELSRRLIPYEYHGVVYDSSQLAKILSRCQIGFNGYVNTSAAFSYKATTYFSAGLPILNSMEGDLWELTEANRLGFNYQAGDTQSLVDALNNCELPLLHTMSDNCRRFASEELNRDSVGPQMSTFLRECIVSKLEC